MTYRSFSFREYAFVSFLAPVTLTLTRWPSSFTCIPWRYTGCVKMKFRRQVFRKLSYYTHLVKQFFLLHQSITRNSSEDEIANVNFLCHDILHALQNTVDSCINSARDRRDVLERRFTKVIEITQCNGHYAVQGHSRSPILVPIESSYTSTSYQWLIVTYLLSCTVSKLWLIIGHIFASERGVPHFNALAGVIP